MPGGSRAQRRGRCGHSCAGRAGHHRRRPAIKPGYLPGFGILPAESVRELAETATLQPVEVPTSRRHPIRGIGRRRSRSQFVRWRDLTCRWPGCDRPVERCDIDHTVPYPHRADTSVEQQAVLPHPSSDQNVLHRDGRLDRSATARRHHRVHRPDRAHLHHRTPRRQHVLHASPIHRRAADPTGICAARSTTAPQ